MSGFLEAQDSWQHYTACAKLVMQYAGDAECCDITM